MIKRGRGRPRKDAPEFNIKEDIDIITEFSHEEKLFLAKCFAEKDSNKTIQDRFRKEYGRDLLLSPFQMKRMRNPNHIFYNHNEDEYRAYFHRCATIYEQQVAYIPITSKAKRLERLEDMYHDARDAHDIPLAASLLKQAAQEVGDVFTNKVNARLNVNVNHMSLEDIDKKLAELGYNPEALHGEVITLEDYEVIKQN